jgi:Zn-dependent protease with chaperone function
MIREFLWASSQLVSLVLPAVLLFTGWGARISGVISRRFGGNSWATLSLFAAVYLVLLFVIEAPIVIALGKPLAQAGVQTFVQIVVAALVLWIPYRLMRLRLWWLWSALALVPVAFAILVALPVFVDPLTAHYDPLTNRALGAQIAQLAARCGVHDIPVFIGGDDDTVAGLGPTKRIFLASDIAKAETHDQVIFTVGHELKHYVMGDSWKAFAIVAAVLLVGFWLVDLAGRWAIARWRFGFSEMAEPASLPLAAFIFTLFWLAILPLFNWEARRIEFDGDRFSLELTHQNAAAATLFQKWIRAGEPADSDMFFKLFRQTHPSLSERIAFARSYRPWETGQPLVYESVCSR